MIGIVAGIAQRVLGILLNLDGGRGSKQCTDVDGHVENREACIALVLILRVVIQVANHYLQVALEQSGAEANQQQGGQHHNEGKRVATQGDAQQQIACKHDDDTRGNHPTKAKLVGKHTTKQREEIHKHEECAIDGTCQSRRQSIVCPQKQCKHCKHRVVTEALSRIGESQRK